MLYTGSGVSLEKTPSLSVCGVRLTEVYEIPLIIYKPALKNRFHLTHIVPCMTIKCVCFLFVCNNWSIHPQERSRFFLQNFIISNQIYIKKIKTSRNTCRHWTEMWFCCSGPLACSRYSFPLELPKHKWITTYPLYFPRTMITLLHLNGDIHIYIYLHTHTYI